MKQKILFVIPSLVSGGAEHQTINQINYLVEAGNNNIRLLVLSGKYPLLPKLKLRKEYIKTIDSNNLIAVGSELLRNLPMLSRETSRYIRQERITDIIAILPMAHMVCRLAVVALKLSFAKAPQLNVYFRDVYYSVAPLNTLYKKIYNSVSSLLARLTDTRSLFISQAVRKDIAAHFFVRQPLVLPNSLPVRKIGPEAGEALLLEKGLDACYKIMIPGRLHFKKGHLLFLDAFAQFIRVLKLEAKEVQVFIAGEGPMRLAISERIEELGLQAYVILNGDTENNLLLSLYRCMDLVVIPSSHEGFGNVAIEGLMQQSLMLVSKTGGLAEIIRDGENGFAFENGNAKSLRDKLIYIYTNKSLQLVDRQELYREFLEKYTVDRQVREISLHCHLNWKQKSKQKVLI